MRNNVTNGDRKARVGKVSTNSAGKVASDFMKSVDIYNNNFLIH